MTKGYFLLQDKKSVSDPWNCRCYRVGAYTSVRCCHHDDAVFSVPIDIDLRRTGFLLDDCDIRNWDAGFDNFAKRLLSELIRPYGAEESNFRARTLCREKLVGPLPTAKVAPVASLLASPEKPRADNLSSQRNLT